MWNHSQYYANANANVIQVEFESELLMDGLVRLPGEHRLCQPGLRGPGAAGGAGLPVQGLRREQTGLRPVHHHRRPRAGQ